MFEPKLRHGRSFYNIIRTKLDEILCYFKLFLILNRSIFHPDFFSLATPISKATLHSFKINISKAVLPISRAFLPAAAFLPLELRLFKNSPFFVLSISLFFSLEMIEINLLQKISNI